MKMSSDPDTVVLLALQSYQVRYHQPIRVKSPALSFDHFCVRLIDATGFAMDPLSAMFKLGNASSFTDQGIRQVWLVWPTQSCNPQKQCPHQIHSLRDHTPVYQALFQLKPCGADLYHSFESGYVQELARGEVSPNHVVTETWRVKTGIHSRAGWVNADSAIADRC